jgi:hypothetical protein
MDILSAERERSHSENSFFFTYNIYNNYIINNKSDEIKILKIRMAVRHCQWCVAKTPLAMAFLLSFFFLFSVFLKKKTKRRQWENATPTGVKLLYNASDFKKKVFTTVIRIFKFLISSLLLLII